MRKFILIAAVVLASAAAAQAGESRSLSTGTGPTSETTNTTPASVSSDAQRADNDTPRYSVRPAAALNMTVSTSPPSAITYATPRLHHPTYRPSARNRPAVMRQMHQRPHRGHLIARRIVAALHRYGIYW